MKLIEQLGGYERAKHEFEMIKEMKPVYPGEIETNDRLLLEYRRQHNIFEVGDKIVFTDKDASDEVLVFKCEELIPIHSYWFKWQSGGEGCVFSTDEIKHATDAEIKAGKRLEVG